MVMVLPAQEAVTPTGSPVAVPIPVAPVVEMVIEGDIAVFVQTVGLEDGSPAVFAGLTVNINVLTKV